MHREMRPITWVLMVLMVSLFAATQLSNAMLPQPPLLKVGNLVDEAGLTNSVLSSKNLAEMSGKLRGWGPTPIYTSYYLNRLLGLETHGRRACAVLLVTLTLLCVGYLCRSRSAFGDLGLLLFSYLFLAGTEMGGYATLSVLPYPMAIMFSSLFVGMVMLFYGRPVPLRWMLLAILLFTLMGLVNLISLVAIYAVACTLFIGEVIGHRWSWKQVPLSSVRLGALIAFPTLLMLALMWFRPSGFSELWNPDRSLHLYFFSSDAPKNLLGAVSFIGKQFAVLVAQGTTINGRVLGGTVASLSSWVLGGAFMIGLVTSLFSSNAVRRALVLFFLFGTLGHLILNFANLLPYGEMRYFLSYFVLYPLIATLGLIDIAKGAQWLFRLSPERIPLTFRRYAAFVFAGMLILSATAYAGNTCLQNMKTRKVIQTAMNHYLNDAGDPPYALVTDYWTARTVEAEYPGLVRTASKRDYYRLNINLQSVWGFKRWGPDDIDKWNEFLSEHKRIFLITSIRFSEKYHSVIYRQVAKRFSITPIPGSFPFFFAELRPSGCMYVAGNGALEILGGSFFPEGNSKWAWMKKKARLRIGITAEKISFDLAPMRKIIEESGNLTVEVRNDATGEIDKHQFTDLKPHTFTLKSPLQGQEVTIESSTDYCAVEHGGKDPRRLSVQLMLKTIKVDTGGQSDTSEKESRLIPPKAGSAASFDPIPIPPEAGIPANFGPINKKHPYLLISEEFLDSLSERVKQDPVDAIYARMVENTQTYMRQSWNDIDGIAHPFRNMYWRALCEELTLMTCVTKDRQYLEHALVLLRKQYETQAWADLYHPRNPHYLGNVMMGLCFLYDVAYRELAQEDRAMLEAMIRQAGRRQYEESFKDPWGKPGIPSRYLWNHSMIGYATLGMAAITLGNPDDETELWLARAATPTFYYLTREGFTEQGINREGVYYSGYANYSLAPFAEALRLNFNIPWITNERVARYMEWVQYEMLPGGGLLNNFNDCLTDPVPALRGYLTFNRTHRLPIARYAWDHLVGSEGNGTYGGSDLDYINFGGLAEALMLYPLDQAPIESTEIKLPTALFCPTHGELISKTGWDKDATMFAFNSNPFIGGVHCQSDEGTFTLSLGSTPIIIDSGMANKLKEGSASQTIGHNCILVDGKGMSLSGEGAGVQGKIVNAVLGEEYDYALADNAAAYSFQKYNPVARAFRSVCFVKQPFPYVLIWDDMAKNDVKEHRYEFLQHMAPEFLAQGQLEDGSFLFASEQQGVQLLTQFINPGIVVGRSEEVFKGHPLQRFSVQASALDLVTLILPFTGEKPRYEITKFERNATGLQVNILWEDAAVEHVLQFPDAAQWSGEENEKSIAPFQFSITR